TGRGRPPRATPAAHDGRGPPPLRVELGGATPPAPKTATDGIQAVQRRLMPASDGRPRLFLMRDARVHRDETLAEAGKPTSTVEEIVGYVWDNQPGKPPKETPVKEDDHGMDALRYAVAKIDLVGTTRVRWL